MSETTLIYGMERHIERLLLRRMKDSQKVLSPTNSQDAVALLVNVTRAVLGGEVGYEILIQIRQQNLPIWVALVVRESDLEDFRAREHQPDRFEVLP